MHYKGTFTWHCTRVFTWHCMGAFMQYRHKCFTPPEGLVLAFLLWSMGFLEYNKVPSWLFISPQRVSITTTSAHVFLSFPTSINFERLVLLYGTVSMTKPALCWTCILPLQIQWRILASFISNLCMSFASRDHISLPCLYTHIHSSFHSQRETFQCRQR